MIPNSKKVCKHLYFFDTEAACYYVNAYCEEWDEDEKQFGNKNGDSK